uniref:Uncharacterized protein n=1 Tax=Anguilla anguilla TaxID=7936 RepID=A0A0E9WLV3_ANGAN
MYQNELLDTASVSTSSLEGLPSNVFWLCTPLECLAAKDDCIQGLDTHSEVWQWIIDALRLFCCLWSRGSC